MADALPTWEVHAIRLGTVERAGASNFLSGHGAGMMRLDFVMWLLQGPHGAVVVDTGFSAEAGLSRDREASRAPGEAVRQLGLDPHDVGAVVLTHAHYDHAGNIDDFPRARVVIQARELEYVTGARMRHPSLNHFFDVDDVVGLVRAVHRGNVDVVEGRHDLFPGVELHLLGGHTPGLQVVRVHTRRGWIVLASDALHYYANFHRRDPFPAVVDLPQMLDGYDTLRGMVDSDQHLVPGHDPEVFVRFPGAGLPEGVVALHQEPLRMDSSTGRK